MKYILYEKFKETEDYQQFIKNNPDIGNLKIEAFTAYGAVPISDTQILITKEINGKNVLFFNGYTNSSGIIEKIELPAPPSVAVAAENDLPLYTIYDLTAIHEGFETIKKYRIGMFGGINIIQYVKMTPQVELKGVETNGD